MKTLFFASLFIFIGFVLFAFALNSKGADANVTQLLLGILGAVLIGIGIGMGLVVTRGSKTRKDKK